LTSRVRKLATLATLATGVATVAAGCGTRTIEGSRVSQRIADGLERQVGQRPEHVRCPDQIEATVGKRARCTIVGTDGSELGVTVTIKNERGRIAYTVDNRQSKPPTKRPSGR
jgi:hypothetical protein